MKIYISRAYVNMVQQDIVAGLFIDYGDCFVTSSDLVRPLDPQFCKLPCQAIKAKLHGKFVNNLLYWEKLGLEVDDWAWL